jgi:hypothetical protein
VSLTCTCITLFNALTYFLTVYKILAKELRQYRDWQYPGKSTLI